MKAITAANAEAAHSVSRANAQAAHDAAMLDAIEDWKLSRNESLTDLLFTEGQSRETYNIATSNVYANWENGIGNLLGDKPEGTGWEGRTGENNTETTNGEYGGMGGFLNFNWFGEEDEEESDTPERPEEPSIAQSVSVNIVGYRDWLKSMPIITPKGTLIRGGIVKGVRDWGIDVIAGAIALGAHDTIKKVERTPNADAAYFLAWAGESDIPTLMTANVPINSRRVEYLQSLAKEKALDLNIGHAELGVASSTFLDEVTLEGAVTVATGASSKLLSTSLRISSKVTSNSIELALKSARRFDNEAIEAASKGTQLLDNANGIPLEKLLSNAPINSLNAETIRALRAAGLNDAAIARHLEVLGDIHVFRGTTEGFAGNPVLQRIGLTPTSVDPVVATASASEGASKGVNPLILFGPRSAFGETLGMGNVRCLLEMEVSIGLTPSQFAATAPNSVSLARARAILAEMGIEVPSSMYNADAFLRQSPRLTPEQIRKFIERASQ